MTSLGESDGERTGGEETSYPILVIWTRIGARVT